jgi:hypothetical protein
MADLTLMTTEDARQVLSTIRQLRASGIMSSGFVANILKRWPRNISESAGKLEFFKFVEDFRPAGTLAKRCDRSGTIYEPTSAAIRIGHKWNKPAGANADYYGLCWNTGSRWEFLQGPCPDLSCDEADSVITIGTPPEATVNEVYEHEIVVIDFADEPTITGLPDGLTATIDATDTDEWTITITGTPTTEGEFTVIVSGTTLENDCPIAAGFNLLVNPCDVVDSTIDLGEIPEATQFEEWDHEITFTDVEDVEITGLPEEITATIGAGTITLESDELPATGTYQITIRGTTTENGCPIEVEFALNILPCDSAGSAIIGTSAAWEYTASGACYVGQFGVRQLLIIDATDATVTGLPDWLEYEVIPQGDSLLLLISGTPPTGTCSIPAGTLDGWTLYGDTDYYYRDVEVSATTLENECAIKKTFRLFLIGAGATCPSPTDYGTLGASFEFADYLPGQPFPWSISAGSGISGTVEWTNVEDISVSGNPSGSPVFIGEPDAPPNTVSVVYDNPTVEGSYNVVITGKVASGTHEGCTITFSYTLVVTS